MLPAEPHDKETRAEASRRALISRTQVEMATSGQPSAPPFQNYRARWLQTPLTNEHVAPLFDYESYRASRNAATRPTGAAMDPGCMGLSSIVNACYESPYDRMGMQQQQYQSNNHYQNAPYTGASSVQAAVGPPACMAGGGYDSTYHNQKGVGPWNWLYQPSADASYNATARESDTEQQKHVPWITLAIAIAYTVIFIMIMQQNDCPSSGRKKACLLAPLRRFAFQPFGENPLLGPSSRTLLRMGALEAELVTKAHEGWRLLSTMWLHAGVLHIMGSVLGMMLLGIPLERQLGFVKVGVIYVLSGFMGSIFSALMVHGRVSAGPSGAFMGLLGATLSSIAVNWDSYHHRSRTLAGVVFFIALNTVYGLLPFVDNFMHLGGATTGFLIGNLFFIRHDFRCRKSSAVYDPDLDMPSKRKHAIMLDIAWIFSMAALVVATTMGMVALFSGMNIGAGCSWCQYLTCVPSRFWKCSGDRKLSCNPSSFHGGLRVTCMNGRMFDYSTVQYASKLTPEIEGLCIKACV